MTIPPTTADAFVREAAATARGLQRLAAVEAEEATASDVAQTAVCLTVCAWLEHTAAGKFEPPRIGELNDAGQAVIGGFAEWLNQCSLAELLVDFQRTHSGEQFGLRFFELFLHAFDPRTRLKRGVFFTPAPVAQFIVERADDALRTQLRLERGLADLTCWADVATRFARPAPKGVSPDEPFVQILDPALGTGTLLIAVIHRVWQTFQKCHAGAELRSQWNLFVPGFVKRMTGFELMATPLAISRTQLLLKLAETGYAFETPLEWQLFQTNSLELPLTVAPAVADAKVTLVPTVILGNPPYRISSQNQNPWIEELCQPVKQAVKHEKNRQPLNDDYVKFFVLALHYARRSGLATLGYVTNRSYLDGMLHRGLRQQLLEAFPHQEIIDLGGDTRGGTTGDQNVFDITQGVAVLVGSPAGTKVSYVRWQGFRSDKLARLEAPSDDDLSGVVITPESPDYWLAPRAMVPREYLAFPSLKELMPFSSPGVKTSADSVFIGFTPEELRSQVQAAGHEWSESLLQRVLYRPFDVRWLYYDPALLGRPRPELARHVLGHKNVSLIAMRQVVQDTITHFGVCEGLCCHGTFYLGNKGQDYQFPLWLAGDEPRVNLELSSLPRSAQDYFAGEAGAMRFVTCVYAIFYSTDYRQRYAAGLKSDFPRLPLMHEPLRLSRLSVLGLRLVNLHLGFQRGEFQRDEPSNGTSAFPLVGGGTEKELPDTRISPGWPKHENNTAWLNPACGIAGVSSALWSTEVGGYQVCRKWLKDRTNRPLSPSELGTYQSLLATAEETRRITVEIDAIGVV